MVSNGLYGTLKAAGLRYALHAFPCLSSFNVQIQLPQILFKESNQ